MIEIVLKLSVVIPLIVFFVILFINKKDEKLISKISILGVAIHLTLIQIGMFLWIVNDFKSVNLEALNFYDSDHIKFGISFFFDKVSLAFSVVGSILTFLITIYSRVYMHKEQDYKKFFATILLFFAGYNFVVISGNFETLFLGWELLGVSSFLLIGFYRYRFLPVRNSAKVYAVYRLGDLGLLLVGWVYFQIWNEPISFAKINAMDFDHNLISASPDFFIIMCACILLSACAKSSQFPFSSWLARAMEGPTPSSAIFYGSLSVHIGVFILLRTAPLWHESNAMSILVGVIGLVTAVTSALTSRVQSSIKGQIAYSSLTQIGIMFVEMSLGYHNLVIFHFIGNAFMRTYQLLVSPSVVSYLIRESLYLPAEKFKNLSFNLPDRLKVTLYVLSVKEWGLDVFLERFIYKNIKKMGGTFCRFVKPIFLVSILCLLSLGILQFNTYGIDQKITNTLAFFISLLTLIYMLSAVAENKSILKVWHLVFFSHLSIALVVLFTDHFEWQHILLYMSGIILSWAIGTYILRQLLFKIPDISLRRMQGLSKIFPRYDFLFLICCLGISGFPITPTFIGEDLIFHHIHQNNIWTVFFASAFYVLDGVVCIRLYTLLFSGDPGPERIAALGSNS